MKRVPRLLLVAFALSLLVHLIVALILHPSTSTPDSQAEVVSIEHRPGDDRGARERRRLRRRRQSERRRPRVARSARPQSNKGLTGPSGAGTRPSAPPQTPPPPAPTPSPAVAKRGLHGAQRAGSRRGHARAAGYRARGARGGDERRRARARAARCERRSDERGRRAEHREFVARPRRGRDGAGRSLQPGVARLQTDRRRVHVQRQVRRVVEF